ncbi:MAG: hypothetical protein AAFO87_01560 [Cyanobacteria bacterium J06607_6]
MSQPDCGSLLRQLWRQAFEDLGGSLSQPKVHYSTSLDVAGVWILG